MSQWNHVVSGAAIHLLGVGQWCSCEAQHVCKSCQGQDDRRRAVNAKLLAALEIVANRSEDPGMASIAREAIEEARK